MSDFFSDLLDNAKQRNSRFAQAMRSPAAITFQRVADNFSRNNDLLWASALTYTTGLSIVPILAVALSAPNGLGGAEDSSLH